MKKNKKIVEEIEDYLFASTLRSFLQSGVDFDSASSYCSSYSSSFSEKEEKEKKEEEEEEEAREIERREINVPPPDISSLHDLQIYILLEEGRILFSGESQIASARFLRERGEGEGEGEGELG